MSDNNNGDAGLDQLNTDTSTKTFTSALLFNAIVAVAVFCAFCIVRHWNKRIYQPRTYLVNKDVQSPELPAGAFSWITASFQVQDDILVERVGLDAYMFLRFLRMCSFLFGIFTLVAIPVLIPLNVVNGKGETGMMSMTLGNVAQSWRLWFHLLLTIGFCASCVYMLWKEMIEYTHRRHAYLMSEKHSKTPQATTILVTGIPKELANVETLTDIFDEFPGGIRSVWLNKNPKNLVELCQERDDVTLQLDAAENLYIRSAYGKTNEAVRPIGRTGKIPFVGPKVDLIEFYTGRLTELNKQIDEIQRTASPSALNSAFIQFNTQFAAHSAVQTVVHPMPFRMAPMFVEISPLDVVWDNLNFNTITRKGRTIISMTAATALAILWFFPVAFVTSISNLDALVDFLPFLDFLRKVPTLAGIIQGILPPLFMGILMSLLPIILTVMSTFEGHVRYSSITLAVMSKYFLFLVINVLLVSTLAGGIFKTLGALGDNFGPKDVINLLGKKLPASSTFFVTYALLQGMGGPMMELLQIAPLVLNFVFIKLLAKSPRQVWNIQGRLRTVNFGTLFPPQTLMFCIGIVYSTISPLVLPFVFLYFTAFYFVYRHQFLYVYQQSVETGGLAFPLAVKQAYTGLFIFEVTIFGIFLLKLEEINTIPHMVFLLLMIIATIVSYTNLNEAFNPLVTFLPVALFSPDVKLDHRRTVKSKGDQDEEASAGEKSVVPLSEKTTLPAISKLEYDEVAEVSSQMPAIPTPNPSVVDSVSYSRQSLHPSVHTNRDAQNRHSSIHQPQDDVDPELRRLQEQAYLHPAIYSRQMPIWLPQDERGLAAETMTRLQSQGIVVSTAGADLDTTSAKTHVSGIVFAPGEESRYRLEHGV